MQSASGIAILYGMVIIELLIIRFQLKEPLPWKEVVLNLNSGHILLWVGRGMEVMGYAYVFRHFSFGLVGLLPIAMQWVLAFILWDFCFYWLHRLHHALPILWSVHVVHHQGEHFSLSLGVRNSWYSSLTSLPFFVPLALIGISVEQFVVVGSIHYFIQFYNHNRVIKKSGVLEYFMVTPAHHIVHHGKNPEYLDKNCAGTFIIWDKLFGTFQEALPDVPVQLGIRDPIHSESPYWINNVPFMRYFGMRSPFFMPAKRPLYSLHDALIGVGGLLLFAWLLYYVSVEMVWGGQQLSYLFLLIFGSTLSICGLAEGRLWGIIAWVLVFFAGFMSFVLFYPTSKTFFFLFYLNLLHTFLVILLFLRQRYFTKSTAL